MNGLSPVDMQAAQDQAVYQEIADDAQRTIHLLGATFLKLKKQWEVKILKLVTAPVLDAPNLEQQRSLLRALALLQHELNMIIQFPQQRLGSLPIAYEDDAGPPVGVPD